MSFEASLASMFLIAWLKKGGTRLEKSFPVRSICRIQTRRLLRRKQSVARRLMKKLRQNRRVPGGKGVETTAIIMTVLQDTLYITLTPVYSLRLQSKLI